MTKKNIIPILIGAGVIVAGLAYFFTRERTPLPPPPPPPPPSTVSADIKIVSIE